MDKHFTGKPCIKCGATLRYVNDRKCVACVIRRMNEWKLANAERHRENNRKSDRSRPDRNRKFNDVNPEYHNEHRRRNIEKSLISGAKFRAKRDGIEFTITHNDIVIPAICPVLGIPIMLGDGRKDNSPSLDRMDNDKGYTKDNVYVISWRANRIKSDATRDEHLKIAEYMA